MSKLKISKQMVISLIMIISVYALMYGIYRNIVLTSDDYAYIFSKADGALVSTIGEAFASFLAEYKNWSGRLAHLLDIIFLISKGRVFSVVTPLVIALLPFVIYYFIFLGFPESIKDYTIMAPVYAIYAYFPNLYTFQMLYWHTACITYLYMPFFMLILLLPFRRMFELNSDHSKPLSFAAIVLLFMLSMTQEIVGAVCVAFIFYGIVYKLYRSGKVHFTYYVSFFCSIAGFLTLYLAPGNAIRQNHPSFSWWVNAPLTGKLKNGLGYFIFNQYHVQNYIMIIMIILICIYLLKSHKRCRFMMITYHLAFIMALFVLKYDGLFSWEVLENWKYTLNYFGSPFKQILFPLIFYGLETALIVLSMGLFSIEEKNPIWFVLTCAVFCSNLVVIATPVGTSYMSFTGVLLTIGLICKLLSAVTDNISILKCVGFLSIALFLNFSIKDNNMMKTIKAQEQTRIAQIENQKGNDTIYLSRYTYDVWEGNVIYDKYREYYGIPADSKVIVE